MLPVPGSGGSARIPPRRPPAPSSDLQIPAHTHRHTESLSLDRHTTRAGRPPIDDTATSSGGDAAAALRNWPSAAGPARPAARPGSAASVDDCDRSAPGRSLDTRRTRTRHAARGVEAVRRPCPGHWPTGATETRRHHSGHTNRRAATASGRHCSARLGAIQRRQRWMDRAAGGWRVSGQSRRRERGRPGECVSCGQLAAASGTGYDCEGREGRSERTCFPTCFLPGNVLWSVSGQIGY